MPDDSKPPVPESGASAAPVPWWLLPLDRQERAKIEKQAQKIHELPGVWHMHQEAIPREGASGMVVKPRYLRRLDPGAPLPDDVDPAASRFEIVAERLPPPWWLRFLAPLGLLTFVGSFTAMVVLDAAWGGLVGAVSLVPILLGLYCPYAIVVRPSEAGRWVEAPGVIEPGKPPPWSLAISGRALCSPRCSRRAWRP